MAGHKAWMGWARCVALALACAAAQALHAQTPSAGAPPKPAAAEPPPAKAMDTGESIGFMGKSLWFEVRRRLNLTTEEEEKKHKEETRQVKLKVGGFQVERSAVEEPKPAPPPKPAQR